MCGIAGLIGNDDISTKRRALEQMLQITRHRGPDHTGVFVHESAAIGMNRLSIIDLSEEANQPIYSEDGRFAIVYNGEIYNYRELKSELIKEGIRFKTNSDTEVVLQMYIMYREKMLSKIRGMFAFAIWDCLEERLFGARDHLGIKPFLYSFQKNTLIFCSELKGILASNYINPVEIDTDSLSHFFTLGHTISPKTIIKGVQSLKSGHYFTYHDHNFIETRYWLHDQISPLSEKDISYDEVTKQVRDIVLESVSEELISDVPLGVFLSGGLDSSVVVASMRECGASEIKTFCVGFDLEHSAIDECDEAQLLANYYKTDHHSVKIKDHFISQCFDDFISGLDQPSADGLNTYLVSQYAKKDVTVALSGLGGDELFCGYIGFKQFLNRKQIVPEALINAFLDFRSLNKFLPDRIYKDLLLKSGSDDDILFYIFLMQRHTDDFTNQMINRDFKNYNHTLKTKEFIDENYAFSTIPVNKVRELYISQFMTNMLLRDSDAVAMKNSLEVRFPLIDYRLVEFSYQIPSTYLIKDLKSSAYSRNYLQDDLKRVLIDAFRDKLPEELLNRSKRGFNLPINHWMKTALKSKLEAFIENPAEILNPKMVRQTYDLWKKEKSNWKKLWGAFIIDSWYKSIMRDLNPES